MTVVVIAVAVAAAVPAAAAAAAACLWGWAGHSCGAPVGEWCRCELKGMVVVHWRGVRLTPLGRRLAAGTASVPGWLAPSTATQPPNGSTRPGLEPYYG